MFAAVGGGVYYGHDGMRRWHRDLQEAWGEQIRLQPEAYFDLGEYMLTFFVYHGRGEHSGAEGCSTGFRSPSHGARLYRRPCS